MSSGNYLVLVGPPNSGKTTLFNWITGYSRQTVNYPGSTVELAFGRVQKKMADVSWGIIDTPGIYSFFSSDSEIRITKQILSDSSKKGELKGIILVLDATRLMRQLPFVFHLKAMGIPFVVALTMYDIQKKDSKLNLSLLSKRIGQPIFPIEGLLGGGVSDLVKRAYDFFNRKKRPASIQFPKDSWFKKEQENLLKKTQTIINEVKDQGGKERIGQRTKVVDSWLLHPVYGFGFLFTILFAFFSGIFWLASPLMDFIDRGFARVVNYLVQWGEGIWVMDFLANGVLTSFGAFFVFVPQVYILFLGIYLLEDSGYLARAATIVDGPFSRIGLSGKSLIPFLSGFACAIPATISARGISSKRERWMTIFVIPLMTCSARLPVYALLLSFLFYQSDAWKPGLIMSLIYFLSLVLGVMFAGILNLFFKPDKKSSFIMELPLYRFPVLSNVFISAWSRTKHFIGKAGPVIFIFAILMWVATHFPRYPELNAYEQVQKSYAGRFGQVIEPVFEKMGGDWRVGVGLLSAFVAREVFVSVLAVTLKNTESEENNRFLSSMVQTMKEARLPNGQPLFSNAAVMALLVFFIISLQCLSTTGIVYKETGSLLFAGTQLVVFNVLGYVGAVLAFHLF